jgi:hypothetical protein
MNAGTFRVMDYVRQPALRLPKKTATLYRGRLKKATVRRDPKIRA